MIYWFSVCVCVLTNCACILRIYSINLDGRVRGRLTLLNQALQWHPSEIKQLEDFTSDSNPLRVPRIFEKENP